jgi:hypothetical protein
MSDFNIENLDSPFSFDSPFAPDEGSRGNTPRGNQTTQTTQQPQGTGATPAQPNNTSAQATDQQVDYSQYYYGTTGQDASGNPVDYQSYYYQGQNGENYYYDPNQQYDYSQYYYGQEYAYGEEQGQGYDAFQQIQQEVDAAQQQLQNTSLTTTGAQGHQQPHATTTQVTSHPAQVQQPVQPVVPVEDPKIKLFQRVSTQNEDTFKDEFPRVGVVDFYEPDSDSNIRYEDPGKRIISAATLPKILEKLTSSQAGKSFTFSFVPKIIYIFVKSAKQIIFYENNYNIIKLRIFNLAAKFDK